MEQGQTFRNYLIRSTKCSISVLVFLLVFLLILLWRGARAWRWITTAGWRRRTFFLLPTLVLFYSSSFRHSYFFFLTLGEDELDDESLEELLLLLLFLCQSKPTYLFSNQDSHFSWLFIYLPMPFFAAKSTLVVGLRSFWFFGLTSNFNSDSLVVDVFTVHLLHSFVDWIIRIKNLDYWRIYNEGIISDHANLFDFPEALKGAA